jgi:topoisomerase-4 subunit B
MLHCANKLLYLQVFQMMDMLLSKKRASDRKKWLEEKGNLANV